ncbi:MAG: hypothetical protein AM324_015400 [Candidatus Thorarchaeota archaeon SMTZ1-83]|nr:MAG: hypothetical protein AM324_16520 [Candidatus Thorarchaeota archaeon SMTZ1-83]
MKRQLVAVGIVLLVIGSVGVYLFLFPMGTSFHYEKAGTADNAEYRVGVRNIRDCEINVSFVDDSDLLYSLDIEMYGFSSSTAFYIYEDDTSVLLNYYTGPAQTEWTGDETRIKSLDIVLGIGKAYNIILAGINLTASITYSNGALIGQSTYLHYLAVESSTVFVYDGYDVDVTTLGLEDDPVRLDANLGGQGEYTLTSAMIDIDLPYFYFGDVDIVADDVAVSASGWNKSEVVDSWSTEYVDGIPPEVFVDIFSSDFSATLVKSITP